MTRQICLVIILGLVLASCGEQPNFSLGSVTMNCDQSVCAVSFDVTNESDGTLPLIYEISLFQNHVRSPNTSGLVVVGSGDGSIDILSSQTRTVEVEIEVTEKPNGSKVSVFDSRTPKFILEILDS